MSDAENKLPLVKKTLTLLTEQLRPQDTITIVTYVSGEDLTLALTFGADKDKILQVIHRLKVEGTTSGERVMQLAYE